MSLVGPRPTLRYQVDRYDDTQRRRLDVAPGLTGLAQVSGRNSLGWSQRIDADLEYVNTCSLGLDLRIIGQTFTVVLTGQGIDGHNPEDPLVASEARDDPHLSGADAISRAPGIRPTLRRFGG